MKLKKNIFLSDEIQSLFEQNQLGDFQSLWDLKGSWVEEPNYRANGFSGVIRHHLKLADGSEQTIYIKRQQNYFSRRTFKTIFSRQTSVETEYNNCVLLAQMGILATVPYYFGLCLEGGKTNAIIVTKGIEPMLSIENYLKDHQLSDPQIQKMAIFVRNLHQKGICHGALYGKHLYVSPDGNQFTFIDLEYTKKTTKEKYIINRDLRRLLQRTLNWSEELSQSFLNYYYDGHVPDHMLEMAKKIRVDD